MPVHWDWAMWLCSKEGAWLRECLYSSWQVWWPQLACPLLQRHLLMGGGWLADACFSTLAANRLLTALQAGWFAAGLAIHARIDR